MRPHRDEIGITLLELLIAIALSAIITMALITSFTHFSRTQTAQANVIDMQQNLRAGLYLMGREFRMAGYKGPHPSPASTAGISSAKIDTITFTLLAIDDGIDNDADGETDEPSELTTLIYSHYDGDGDGKKDTLGRGVDGGPRSAVAENIQAIEFYYETISGGTISRSTAPVATKAIRAVEITMLAQTKRNDPNFTHAQVYTTASGTRWGPYNDGRRRRLGQSYINFRNQ